MQCLHDIFHNFYPAVSTLCCKLLLTISPIFISISLKGREYVNSVECRKRFKYTAERLNDANIICAVLEPVYMISLSQDGMRDGVILMY